MNWEDCSNKNSTVVTLSHCGLRPAIQGASGADASEGMDAGSGSGMTTKGDGMTAEFVIADLIRNPCIV